MSTKVTITDIANKAGVSIATVSRILNRKDTVSLSTKHKVLQAMDELGYDSNQIKSVSSYQTILTFVPDFANPFYARIIDGIQQTAHENDFEVFLIPTKDIYLDHVHLTNLVKKGGFKGVLWLSSSPPPDLLNLISRYCPMAMCCEYPDDYECSYISIDDVTAAYKAVNYLISTGCKNIGFVNCSLKYKYARHRREGYLKALESARLPLHPEWNITIPSIDYTLAHSAISQALNTEQRPDAFFTCSDVFAAAAINAAQQHGIRVPEDISVIGFDNVETSRMTLPTITTIRQPCFQLGQQSCSILLEKILNPSAPDRQILLNTEFIIRDSTR